MRTAAVILAAGRSTRFGSPKQLADVGGRTMLERVVDVARGAGLDPVIVVVPRGLGPPNDVMTVINHDPSAGLSRSLRLGIAAVPIDADGAVILLGDQPTVAPTLVRALVERASGSRPVVATRAGGLTGPPVLLRREAFPLVGGATGDEGLAPVLRRHPEAVAHVDVERHALDVDVPADLAALIEAEASTSHG